ncbi:hypothetical protein [Moorena sp. SIO4G3]|uniref:hypothetical protein n=1 Tax=Moorena sp. SIO4G3 TaxID=2607821 RepID=UPI00142C0287|nr:hypothetical protein [Moorena sp. SIO4G3]NEO78820.1 hypothetical protein [Moorena sp. SIO4G3]
MSGLSRKSGQTNSKKKQRFSADDLNINTGLSHRKLRDDSDRAKTTDDLDSIDRDVDITDLRSDADAKSNDVISDAQDGAPIGDSINLSVNSNLQRRKSLSDIDSPKSDVKPATKLKRSRSLEKLPIALGQTIDPQKIDELISKIDDDTAVSSQALIEVLKQSDDEDGDNDLIDEDEDLDIIINQEDNRYLSVPANKDILDELDNYKKRFPNFDQLADSDSSDIQEITIPIVSVAANDKGQLLPDAVNELHSTVKHEIDKIENNPFIDTQKLSAEQASKLQSDKKLKATLERSQSAPLLLSRKSVSLVEAVENIESAADDPLVSSNDPDANVADEFSVSAIGVDDETDSGNEVENKIAQYRQEKLNNIEKNLNDIETVFNKRKLKKEKHTRVLEQVTKTRDIISKVKKKNPPISDLDREKVVDALNKLDTVAISYLGDSKDATRQAVLLAVKDNIKRYLKPDTEIAMLELQRVVAKANELEAQLNKIDPTLANKFKQAFEQAISSGETYKKASIKDLARSLATAVKVVSEAGVASDATGGIAKGVFADSHIFGLIEDFGDSLKFIDALRKNGVTTRTVLTGGKVAASVTKNASSAVKSGVTIAEAAGSGSTTATSVATGATLATGVSSVVLGAGVVAHSVWKAGRTQKRLGGASSIEDQKIQTEIKKRIKRKRNRALIQAVGGAIVFTGGVLLIFSTGGIAAPVVFGTAALVASSLAANRAGGSLKKKDITRKELAGNIMIYMNELIANNRVADARKVAEALTNNKLKQNIMLNGAETDASPELQVAALKIIDQKLKTW